MSVNLRCILRTENHLISSLLMLIALNLFSTHCLGDTVFRLEIGESTVKQFQVLRDTFNYTKSTGNQLGGLPATTIDLILADDGSAIPIERGLSGTKNKYWDMLVEPGSWYLRNKKVSVILPISLVEKGANCTHQGTLIIENTQAGYQIATETCQYLQFNAQGFAETKVTNLEAESSLQIIAAYDKEIKSRLPEKSILEIDTDYADLEPRVFAQAEDIEKTSMSAYGAVIDGIHYVSNCGTRAARLTDCSHMALPSYSLAKSIIGGIGLMRLEALYPGAQNFLVKDLVPECQAWGDISLKHLLNNTSGRYGSKSPHRDEDQHLLAFLKETSISDKTKHVCNRYRVKDKPGEQWVYHTTEFWLLGVAMQNFWRQQRGNEKDFYTDLLVPLWRSLGLSPLMDNPHREQDQPLTGWGLTLLRSDIAKLASALSAGDPILADRLDKSMLDKAMQRDAAGWGVAASAADLKFHNGFWAWNAGPTLGCANSRWLPFMSGYGGISVVLLPDGDVYYYFSDGGVFQFSDVIQHLHTSKSIC
jgi:hypothetical protein